MRRAEDERPSQLRRGRTIVAAARRSTWTPVAYVCHFRKVRAPVDTARRRTAPAVPDRFSRARSRDRSGPTRASSAVDSAHPVTCRGAHPAHTSRRTRRRGGKWRRRRSGLPPYVYVRILTTELRMSRVHFLATVPITVEGMTEAVYAHIHAYIHGYSFVSCVQPSAYRNVSMLSRAVSSAGTVWTMLDPQ